MLYHESECHYFPMMCNIAFHGLATFFHSSVGRDNHWVIFTLKFYQYADMNTCTLLMSFTPSILFHILLENYLLFSKAASIFFLSMNTTWGFYFPFTRKNLLYYLYITCFSGVVWYPNGFWGFYFFLKFHNVQHSFMWLLSISISY